MNTCKICGALAIGSHCKRCGYFIGKNIDPFQKRTSKQWLNNKLKRARKKLAAIQDEIQMIESHIQFLEDCKIKRRKAN